jgi:hypothetical protein
MGGWIQIAILAIFGGLLLWFGYTLFFGLERPPSPAKDGKQGRPQGGGGRAGDIQTCPLCAARLSAGERVKSSVFPSLKGKADRIMHISGCAYCLDGRRLRICPVCGDALRVEDVLIARIFDKPGRSHVHVLGCSHCRGG